MMKPLNHQYGVLSRRSGLYFSACGATVLTLLLLLASAATAASEDSRLQGAKEHMLEVISGYGMKDTEVLEAMERAGIFTPGSRGLEVGTGSGYQAAVLAELTPHVHSIEIIEALLERARTTLKKLGYTKIKLRHGDGYYGWAEEAPFDGIIVTCAAGEIPPPLVDQLAAGGRRLIPVGKRFGTQYLILVQKDLDGSVSSKNLMAVRFVPLVRK